MRRLWPLLLALAFSSPTQAQSRCEAERLFPAFQIVVDVIFGEEERLLRWPDVSMLEKKPQLLAFIQNVDARSFYDETLWPRSVTLGLFEPHRLPSESSRGEDAANEALNETSQESDLTPALLLIGLNEGESADEPSIAEFTQTFAQALAPSPEFTDRWTFEGCRIIRLRSGLSPGLTIAFISNDASNKAKAYCYTGAHLAAGGVSGLSRIEPDELLTELRDDRYVFYGGRSFVYSIYDAVGYMEHSAGSTRCEFALLQMRKAYWLSQTFKRRYAHLTDDLL